MNHRKSPRKHFRPSGRSEINNIKIPEDSLRLCDDYSKNMTTGLQDSDKLYKLKPPKDLQKSELTASPHQSSPAGEVRNAAEGTPQLQDYSAWLRFDEQGVVLPHSILGSLEDFQNYLEAKGEKLVKQIPKPSRELPSEAVRKPHKASVEMETPSHQSNALQHWEKHVRRRRQQQHDLSQLLDRPVDSLLMNQGNNFRGTQEQREILNRVMPLTHSGYGYRVGSEFWSLPQRYGDEMSGILATLTQTERGQKSPVIHVGQPSSIQKELGIISAETRRPASHTWSKSSYLQHQYQELRDVLQEMDIKRPVFRTVNNLLYVSNKDSTHMFAQIHKALQTHTEICGAAELKKKDRACFVCCLCIIMTPSAVAGGSGDFDRLEVVGSGKPFTSTPLCQSPLLEEKEGEKEHKEITKENFDPPAEFDDVQFKVLSIPALRVHGQLATWTGNSTSNKGEAGISLSVFFEGPSGEIISSDLELHNEGSTAIFYSWQKLREPESSPRLCSQKQSVHFYFNFSSGVIHPGDTQQVEFIFKSEAPGLKSEAWQLNTHPVLLQGAPIQVRLSGLALNQDKTADRRLFLENKLEKTVVVKMCRSILHEMLQRVKTPERPGSPAELRFTEEQQFQNKNPKLQYLYESVEDLKRLWQQVNPRGTWDFSVDTLRQAVLSLPDEPTLDSPTKEEALSRLSSLLLELSEPSDVTRRHLTAAFMGQQLWRKLLDTMSDEAIRLRNVFGLPEKETWAEKEEPLTSDTDVFDRTQKDHKTEKKGGGAAKEERLVMRSKFKDDAKGESKSPTTDSPVEENRKKGKRKDDGGRCSRENQRNSSASLTDTGSETIVQPPDDQSVDSDMMQVYTRTLYKKVSALLEDLLDNLFELMEEKHLEDGQNSNC